MKLFPYNLELTYSYRIEDFGFYSWPEPLGPEASAYHEVRQAALEKEWELAKTSVKHVGTANISLESQGVCLEGGRSRSRGS
jgi:hypothetical protein